MPWISEDIKQEHLAKIGNKKTDINRELLETSFRKILKEYNITPIRLKVKEGQTGLFEILSLNDAHINIELTYNPVTLSFYDHEEIESMLYHEAFHPLTQEGSSGILVRDFNSPELTDYISDFTMVYNEYVNHKRQHQYYETSEPFSRVKRRHARYCLSKAMLVSSADFLTAFIASWVSGVGNNTLIARREPLTLEISINICA
jgi:hypothetical protein